ncbi:MAG: hypothetical protein HY292_12785 [Planctomycetes bacterium]|nr:hypothetical protein [Planctomycetota bacterium]
MRIGIPRVLTTALGVSSLAASCASLSGARETARKPIALLPPQNLSFLGGEGKALRDTMAVDPALADETVVPAEKVEAALAAAGVRFPAEMEPSSTVALAHALGVDRLVVASVLHADSEPEPEYAIEMRLLDGTTGEVIRSWIGGLSGVELTEVFGPPSPHDVATVRRRVVARAMAELLHGEGSSLSVHAPEIRSWRSPGLRFHPDDRVAILPLQEGVGVEGGTGFAVARALATALDGIAGLRTVAVQGLLSGFEASGTRDPIELDLEKLRVLSKETGAVCVVTGTITLLQEGGARFGEDPKLSIVARAVDTRTGKMIWTAAIDRRGGVEPGLLALDRERSLAELLVGASWLLAQSLAGDDLR